MSALELTKKVCPKHGKPVTHLCMSKECKDVGCCSECAKTHNLHPQLLIDFWQFSRKLAVTVTEKTKGLSTPRELQLRNKKDQLEDQYQTITNDLKSILAIERNRYFEEFDRLARNYKMDTEAISRAKKGLSSTQYLSELAKRKVLDVKVAMVSGEGIFKLLNRVIQAQAATARDYEALWEDRKNKEKLFLTMKDLVANGIFGRFNKLLTVPTSNIQGSGLPNKRNKSVDGDPHLLSFSRKISEPTRGNQRKKVTSCKRL